MGFGFVIVKFSLFITQLAVLLGSGDLPGGGYSGIVGLIMISLGVVIAILSFLHYKKYEKQLAVSSFYSSSALLLFLTFMIVAGGIILLIYLLSII